MTDSGVHGIKLTYEWSQPVGVIRVLAFFFDGKDGRKLVAHCSALADAEEPYDTVFETTIKTLVLDP